MTCGPLELGVCQPATNLCQMQDGVRHLRQGGAKHSQVCSAGTSAHRLRVPRTVGSVLEWRVENLSLWGAQAAACTPRPRRQALAHRPEEAFHFPWGCSAPRHRHDRENARGSGHTEFHGSIWEECSRVPSRARGCALRPLGQHLHGRKQEVRSGACNMAPRGRRTSTPSGAGEDGHLEGCDYFGKLQISAFALQGSAATLDVKPRARGHRASS